MGKNIALFNHITFFLPYIKIQLLLVITVELLFVIKCVYDNYFTFEFHLKKTFCQHFKNFHFEKE